MKTWRTWILGLAPIYLGGLASLEAMPALANGVQTELAKWSEPAPGNSQFGHALDVDGDFTVVGDPGSLNNFVGTAYLFDSASGSLLWSVPPPSVPSGGGSAGSFGEAVAIGGSRVLVGEPGNDDVTGNAGAVWVLDRATGSVLDQWTASNGGNGHGFGQRVAIDGNLAVVGAPFFGTGDRGMAYVFDVATGVELLRLEPDTPMGGQNFGDAVALHGTLAVVGAPRGGTFASSGSAYVFDLTTGAQVSELLRPSGAQRFGTGVAIEGDRALVGAPTSSVGDPGGRVSLFDLTNGTELATVFASNATLNDRFGHSVDLQGGRFVVGAWLADTSIANTGAAYVFDTESFQELGQLVASDAQGSDSLGIAVAIEGDRVWAGAPLAKAVYVFDTPGAFEPFVYCTAKPSSSGCLAQIGTANPLAQPVSGANDYAVLANGVEGQKLGLVFAGLNGPSVIPFLGGTLCVQPPLAKRGPIVFSGGLGNTCTGAFTTLVNDFALPMGLDGGSGNSAWYQWWYRDPANGAGTLGTALSNALRLDFQ